jgi:hypothetical protein
MCTCIVVGERETERVITDGGGCAGAGGERGEREQERAPSRYEHLFILD